MIELDIIALQINNLEKKINKKDIENFEKKKLEKILEEKQTYYWTTFAKYNSAI